MKKKLFVVMMAIVAMFTTSCQKEMESDANVGETSIVSFNLSTPEMVTRAYGDGTTATVLQYAVYDADGNLLRDLTKTNGTINKSTTVTLQLTNGNEYSIVFWAAAPNAPYELDFANKKMTVDYGNVVSNSDDLDAFYAYHTFKVSGVQTETVTLKRPFAQLNIGTSDYEISRKAGYVPTKSSVTVKKVYETLDFATGIVENEVEANFALADIKKDETFPVSRNDYLAMAYLLVPADNNIVDVDFTYADDSNNAKTREVTNVPVQRNYRTNIYGEILTSNVSINVNIEPNYDGTCIKVGTWSEFKAAMVNGNCIMLTDNITNPSTTLYNIDKNVVIDLNGKSLGIGDSAYLGLKSNSVTIKNGTIEGNVYVLTQNKKATFSNVTFGGTIKYNSCEASLHVAGGDVVAENCIFNGTYNERNARRIVVQDGYSGYFKIDNCQFASTTSDERFYVNPIKANGRFELLNSTIYGGIKVKMYDRSDYTPITSYTVSNNTFNKTFVFNLYERAKTDGITDDEKAFVNSVLNNNTFSATTKVNISYKSGSQNVSQPL